jgi:hypothetical protein
MIAATGKHLLHPSISPLERAPQSINRLLRKQNLQIRTGSASFASLQDLLNVNQELFQIDFISFAQKAADVLAHFNAGRLPNKLAARLGLLAKANSGLTEEILKEECFRHLRLFLFLLTELQGLKIKLLQIVNSQLSTEKFGSRSVQTIYLLFNGEQIFIVDSLKYTFADDLSVQLTNAFSWAQSSQELRLDASNEAVSLKSSQRLKDSLVDKDTEADGASAEEDVKMIHQELFGDMFEHSDDSLMSIQSEDLFQIKKDSRNKQSFNLQIHKTFSEFSTVEEFALDKMLSLNPLTTPQSEDVVQVPAKNKKFQSKVLYEEKDFKNGKLKFYSGDNDFGFIIMENGEEIFVHKDDLIKANIDTQKLAYFKRFYDIQVKFRYIQYQGKMKVNRKAVGVQVTGYVPLCYL